MTVTPGLIFLPAGTKYEGELVGELNAGVPSAEPKVGELTRLQATGAKFRMSSGQIYLHNAHKWNPPKGGASPRWDLIWLAEPKQTALGPLAKAFHKGDSELELEHPLAAELPKVSLEGAEGKGAVLHIDLETFFTHEAAAGTQKLLVKKRARRQTLEAEHAAGAQVVALQSEPDSTSSPPGLTSYEYNTGYSNSLANAKKRIAEGSPPLSGYGWSPVAIVEVPINAAESTEFVFTDVREWLGLLASSTKIVLLTSARAAPGTISTGAMATLRFVTKLGVAHERAPLPGISRLRGVVSTSQRTGLSNQ